MQAGDRIDHTVGLSDLARLGEEVGAERPLAMVHARTDAAADAAIAAVQVAYELGEATSGGPLIRDRVTEDE